MLMIFKKIFSKKMKICKEEISMNVVMKNYFYLLNFFKEKSQKILPIFCFMLTHN